MAHLELPDVDDVRKRLNYDAETGQIIWRDNPGWLWNRRRSGQPAGYIAKDGYHRVCLNNVKYLGHRIAWLIHYGECPDEIDHINGIRSDNRIANLRAVTRSENNMNASRQRNNTSGITGVTWDKQTKRWRASIKKSGRMYRLGRFDTLAEAAAVRKRAERDFGFHENHGREANACDLALGAQTCRSTVTTDW